MRPPFPEVIDSSLIAAFRSCPRKCELDFFLHYKPQDQSVHLVAGSAYAKGLEVARTAYFVEGKPSDDSIALGISACLAAYGDFQCPDNSGKSLARMAGAIEFYFDRY